MNIIVKANVKPFDVPTSVSTIIERPGQLMSNLPLHVLQKEDLIQMVEDFKESILREAGHIR